MTGEVGDAGAAAVDDCGEAAGEDGDVPSVFTDCAEVVDGAAVDSGAEVFAGDDCGVSVFSAAGAFSAVFAAVFSAVFSAAGADGWDGAVVASAVFDGADFASLAFAGVVVPDFCAAAVFAPPDSCAAAVFAPPDSCAAVVFADVVFAEDVDFFADDRPVAVAADFFASVFFATCAFAASFFAAVAFALVFFASAVFGLDFFEPAFCVGFFADVLEDAVFVFDDEPAFADEPAFVDVDAFAVDSLVPDFFADVFVVEDFEDAVFVFADDFAVDFFASAFFAGVLFFAGAVFADFFPAFFFAVVAAAEPFAGTPPDPAFADDELFAFDDFVGAFVVDVFDDADSSAMDQVYSRVTSGEGARGGASQMIPNADATAEAVRTRPPRTLTMRKVLTPRRPGASWRVRRGATLAGVGTAEDRGMTGIP